MGQWASGSPTLEGLFSAGARALLAIMLQNPESVRPSITIEFSCEADELDLLYFDFLSEIIYYKDTDKLLLVPDRLVITSSPGTIGCTITRSTNPTGKATMPQ